MLNTVIDMQSVEQIENVLLILTSNMVVLSAWNIPEIIIKNSRPEFYREGSLIYMILTLTFQKLSFLKKGFK